MHKCDHVSYDYEPKCCGHLRTKDGQLVRIWAIGQKSISSYRSFMMSTIVQIHISHLYLFDFPQGMSSLETSLKE